MKIHIVQKGDTLWEIAKKYGVDFEQLKQINSQLSSPDMIMPGMKIKIPSSSKPAKKETKKETIKETVKEKPKTEHPYKNVSPKPIEAIKEDDVKEIKKIEVEKPIFQVPTMPILDSNLPEIPKEKPIQAPKPKEHKKKEAPKPKVPPKEEQVSPEMPSPEEKMPEYVPPQVMPMMPVCHYVHPCCYHMYQPFAPVAGNMYGGMMHPCHPHMHPHHMMQQPAVGGMVQNESPTMHLPPEDCGCNGSPDYHHMGYQAPGFSVPNNHYEQEAVQPSTLPYPMHASHQSYNPYPTPPVSGGPPSFADLGMRLNEDDNKSEE